MIEELLVIFLICCSSFIGPSTGLHDGKLNYCPPTPNCVSSQSWKWNILHHIKPFKYKNLSREDAFQKLKNLLDKKENVKVMYAKDYYIRTYYFTKVFRFPDRVEFFFLEDSKTVQIRSGSMFGIWDIFHNRIRMEYIRHQLKWD